MVKTQEEPSEIDFISTSGVYVTPFSFIILVQFWVSSLLVILINLWYYDALYFTLWGTKMFSFTPEGNWWYWLLLPLNIYGNIFLFLALNMIIAFVIIRLLNILHPPREGIFKKGSKDWKYFHRRFWTAYFPIWLARAIPFPWSDIYVYKIFGTKIGKSVVAYEGYIDPEFVEIGDHTMTSLHVFIFSHLIYHNRVLIKQVKIGKNCVVGPQSITSPGTIVEDGAVLGANSLTSLNQRLEGDLIHIGIPVQYNFPIKSVEESKKKAEEIQAKDIDN